MGKGGSSLVNVLESAADLDEPRPDCVFWKVIWRSGSCPRFHSCLDVASICELGDYAEVIVLVLEVLDLAHG